MKIKEINIQNYKTIKNLNLQLFNDITLIVGKNNIGKSNTIKALQVYFDYLHHRYSLQEEDFPKKTSQSKIELTFNNIKNTIRALEDRLDSEIASSRPNKERINEIEYNIHMLNAYSKRSDEISTSITVKRSSIEKFEFEANISEKNFNEYCDIVRKKHYADQLPRDLTGIKMTKKPADWLSYDWIKIVEDSEGKEETISVHVEIDGIKHEIKKSEEKISTNKPEWLKSRLQEYIKTKQHVFYIPAYRGGVSEREQAVNQLFDIIIEDLVSSRRGANTEYDTLNDAIWGTGRNSFKGNINSIIENRVKEITGGLLSDSISSIQGIKFKSYDKSDIRKSILKMMIGKPSILLDDGVESDFESKGTGIQSSFMITLMKSLSKMNFNDDRNIILAVEEPEAFAHPQLVREIISSIIKESHNNVLQFIVTTHSSVVVNYVDFNKIQRLHFEDRITTNVTNPHKITLNESDWQILNRIGDLSISEVVFADFVLFVEGEGDRIVLERLFRRFFSDWANRISIISISGNTQIFRIRKLLDYYGVAWTMLVDKDSFIAKKNQDNDLRNDRDLEKFFEKYQIGQEYQENYRKVLTNQNVTSIRISAGEVNAATSTEFLKAMKDNFEVSNDVYSEIQRLSGLKITESVFPYEDAIKTTKLLNEHLQNNNLPFHCMISDLEGMVVNTATLGITKKICGSLFQEAFREFSLNSEHYTENEIIHEIKKFIGSKTHKLENISSGPSQRKKPHVPIEIISTFIEQLSPVYTSEELFSDFPDLKSLILRIPQHLRGK